MSSNPVQVSTWDMLSPSTSTQRSVPLRRGRLSSRNSKSGMTSQNGLVVPSGSSLTPVALKAVTLREVGSVGVSRNAPYRHFADKEGLLTAVAVESWGRLAEALRASGARS
jgi:hypothetical protein